MTQYDPLGHTHKPVVRYKVQVVFRHIHYHRLRYHYYHMRCLPDILL